MSEYVIVRINDKLIPEFQINFAANSKTIEKKSISAWSNIVVEKGETLILILSANIVFTTTVQIPSKSDEIIRKSIPFAIEEDIANEIDDNHYSYLQISEQNFLVSVLNKDIIEKITQALNTNHLNCNQLYSEIFTLPFNKKNTSLLITHDQILTRDNYSGSLVTEKMLPIYLKAASTSSQQFYSQNKIDVSKYPDSHLKIINTDLLQTMTLISESGVNLFQGLYENKEVNKSTKNSLKKTTLLLMFLIASWLIINVYQLVSLSTEIDQLKVKQSNLFLKHVNNASETEKRDPYSAFQSRLKQSQNINNSINKSGFIKSLTYLGMTLAQHPFIKVEGLRQRNDKLEITIHAPSTSALNLFQSNLENNVLSMRVKTGTRESKNDGVNSVITMESL